MSSPECPWEPSGGRASVGLIGPEAARAALRRMLVATYPLLEFDLARHPDPSLADPSRLGEPGALIVCAGATLTPAHGADTTGAAEAGRAVAARLRRGQLLLLTGAVPPGTARGVFLPPITSTGLVPGRDFGLAYAYAPPDDGTARVVGGLDEHGAGAATALLNRAGVPTARASSLEAAEVCGAVAPLVRTVLAATANEIKMACARMGLDAGEVLGASGAPALPAAPGGRAPEPLLLAWGTRRWGASFRLLGVAADINATAPADLVSAVSAALNDAGRAVRGSRVAVIGGVPDTTADGAPAPGLELLAPSEPEARSSATPPRAPQRSRRRGADRGRNRWRTRPSRREYLAAQDCVLIATETSDIDRIVRLSQLVVDSCNATRAVASGREKIVRV